MVVILATCCLACRSGEISEFPKYNCKIHEQSPESLPTDTQHYPGALRVGLKRVASAPPIHKPPTPIRLGLNAASTGTNRFLASVTTMTSRQAKLQEDTHFRVMRILQENPDLTQRELAERVGVSVGGLNYCLKALMEKGLVKMKNFANSKNEFGYFYVLTPRGMAEKAAITHRFLQRKVEEYEAESGDPGATVRGWEDRRSRVSGIVIRRCSPTKVRFAAF